MSSPIATEIEHQLKVLQSSTNNEERKRSAAQLRQLQESDPQAFLAYTWEVISSPTLDVTVRFFTAAAVVEFVEQSWHNNVPKSLQQEMVDRYLQLLLTPNLSAVSVALLRKIGVLLSLMVRRCNARGDCGVLPAPMERVAKLLSETLVQTAADANSVGYMVQCLLVLHLFLKEAEKKRVGGVFTRLCTMLVPVMSRLFASSVSWDYLECYQQLLYLLKCALRVFGSGVFEANFYTYLLGFTWRLARDIAMGGQQEQVRCRQRLMEYAIKVQLNMVTAFPTQLQQLPLGFYARTVDDSGLDESLFALLTAVVESDIGAVVTEKTLCRAMLLIKAIMLVEDSNPFIATCLASLCRSTTLLKRLVERIICLMADDISEVVLSQWDVDPERYASELDREIDDETSLTSCAEELLLALTGSTSCGAQSVEFAWQFSGALLECGSVTQVTAALHAVGVCCYTMPVGQDPSFFVNFLTSKLLPLITSSSHTTSPFVLRRVVWIVGMWCESVQGDALRSQVHMTLVSLLQPSTQTVVELTALRSIENYINDPSFTPTEIPAECVHCIFLAVQRLLPQLHSPSAVKNLAGLVHVMIERSLFDVGNGEMLLNLILPALHRTVNDAQLAFSATTHSSADVRSVAIAGGPDEDSDDDVGKFDAMALSVLLECVGSCVRISTCELEERIWSLFPSVVVPCTCPGSCLAAWVEDQGWELLLLMSRMARTWWKESHDALLFCLDNITREMSARHIIVRSVYTLLLLCPEPGEYVNSMVVDHAMTELVQTQSSAVCVAYFALLAVVLLRGDAALRCQIMSASVQHLLSVESVQSVTFGIYLSLLIAWAALPLPSAMEGGVDHSASSLETLVVVVSQHPNRSSFVESIILLIDVSPSDFVTAQLVAMLERLVATQTAALVFSEEDRTMACNAMKCAAAPPSEPNGGDKALGEQERNPAEMLLELFADEELSSSYHHVVRLLTLFGFRLPGSGLHCVG
ncbi:hypothetical protein ERJ75_000868100 [Trypanosoma vivax]|nr:hypothetical protein ERJ75_000868100 [Trypanosoma vivax]